MSWRIPKIAAPPNHPNWSILQYQNPWFCWSPILRTPPMLVYAFTQSSDRILPSLPAFDTNYPLSKRKLMFQAICLVSILVCWWEEAGGLLLKLYQHTFDPPENEKDLMTEEPRTMRQLFSSEMQRSLHCLYATRRPVEPYHLFICWRLL